jgi:hypothetical protein
MLQGPGRSGPGRLTLFSEFLDLNTGRQGFKQRIVERMQDPFQMLLDGYLESYEHSDIFRKMHT